jgi:hypothetical protein
MASGFPVRARIARSMCSANLADRPLSITITPPGATINPWLAMPPFARLASSRAPKNTCTPFPTSTGSG